MHLALSDIQDPKWRERLASIPTGLTIPRADVDALVRYGEGLVRDNATINAIAAEADFSPRDPQDRKFTNGRATRSLPGQNALSTILPPGLVAR